MAARIVAPRLARLGVVSRVPQPHLALRCFSTAGDSVAVVTPGGAVTRGSRNTEVINMSGLPAEHQQRRVKIFQPAPRNTHFAGGRITSSQRVKKWTLEYDKAATKAGKWTNPLMGWTSTSDPLSNLNVTFSSKEAAIDFCNRNGLAYELLEPKKMKRQSKSYGENFRYWGRVVNHHTKTDPRTTHGIDPSIKDQAILTNSDKLSPETANTSVFPDTQPALAAAPEGAGGAKQYGRAEWSGAPTPPSAKKKAAPKKKKAA